MRSFGGSSTRILECCFFSRYTLKRIVVSKLFEGRNKCARRDLNP